MTGEGAGLHHVRVSSLGKPGTQAPAATRVARPGWRDPRLWIGLLIVAGSVVLGARLLAAVDDQYLDGGYLGDVARRLGNVVVVVLRAAEGEGCVAHCIPLLESFGLRDFCPGTKV